MARAMEAGRVTAPWMARLAVACMVAAAPAMSTGAYAAGTTDYLVRAEVLPEVKAVFGQVRSRNVVPARARIGGTIREIRVSEGSQVKEGEELGLVVDDKLALELAAADAKIKQFRSQLDNTRLELDRARMLIDRGAVTQSRLDQMQMLNQVAQNQVAGAEAERAVVEQRTREGSILAPATGRVLTVPVTVGSVVLPGEEIARIATGQYYLRLSLPERHATEIKEGDTVEIGERGLDGSRSSAPGFRRGRIVKVYPEIADGRVVADVDVEGLGDYFVNERTLVWIPVGRRKVIAVPRTAVSTRHGIDYVRVVTDHGARDVAIVLGETLPGATGSGARVEVLTGLRDGDRIVLP